MKLPNPSRWVNKPAHTDWVEGSKPLELPENELTEWYITKQLWWLNRIYMYEQVEEFFE